VITDVSAANIPAFGMCSAPTNPQVIAASGFSVPCLPVLTPWTLEAIRLTTRCRSQGLLRSVPHQVQGYPGLCECLAGDDQGAVLAFQAQVLDVGSRSPRTPVARS
jgi:hypothetical protein